MSHDLRLYTDTPKNIKLLFCIAILLFLSSYSVNAKDILTNKINTKNPFLMVEQITHRTFSRLKNESAQIRQTPNLLKAVIKEEILPYFNHRYAAAKVLGNVHFKQISKDQFNQFSVNFREYIATSYAQIFTLYDNQTVKYSPNKKFKNKRIISVSIEIISTSRPPIDISFKLRMNKKTKEWKIFDLVAEGISFIDSKRAEFNKLLTSKGIESTNALLIKKSLADIRFNKGKN